MHAFFKYKVILEHHQHNNKAGGSAYFGLYHTYKDIQIHYLHFRYTAVCQSGHLIDCSSIKMHVFQTVVLSEAW